MVQFTHFYACASHFFFHLSRYVYFYSFRKVRSNALRLSDLRETEESRYCKFAHEKFQRGRPDLLCEIKKPPPPVSHNAEQKEVEALKEEIKELEERVSSMSLNLDNLKTSVSIIMDQNPGGPALMTPEGGMNTPFFDNGYYMDSSEVSDGNGSYNVDMNDMLYRPSIAPFDNEDDYNDVAPYTPGTIRPASKPQNRGESIGAFSLFSLNGDVDEDLDFWNDTNAFVNSVCDNIDQVAPPPMMNGHPYYDQTDAPLSSSPHFIPQQRRNSRQIRRGSYQKHQQQQQYPQYPHEQQFYNHHSPQKPSMRPQRYNSSNIKMNNVKNEGVPSNMYVNKSNVDPAALDRLCNAVASMPPHLREVLTNHMLNVMTDPIKYERQADDLTDLAVEAATYSCRPGPKVEYEVVPLAVESALLGAYLDRPE